MATTNGTKLARGANFRCLVSGTPITSEYIKVEGQAGRMGARLMAIVAEGEWERVYIPPTPDHEAIARKADPEWKPETTISGSTQYLGVKPYGMVRFDQLFTDRQLIALTTFSDIVGDAFARIHRDAIVAGFTDDGTALHNGGTEATAYAEAVRVYLGMAVSKMSDAQSSLCRWKTTMDQSIATFGRQVLPMVWDYSEANPFCGMAGDPLVSLTNMMRVVDRLPSSKLAHVVQSDARTQNLSIDALVSTDPPYYDNVPYADLSDYFYIWLRRSLRPIFPDLFATLAVPKTEELVAFAYRHGDGKAGAERFFLDGMTQAIHRISEQAHPAFPVTIYYAFKQSEHELDVGTSSTGWETFLDSVIHAGFAISGTWPVRTELGNRMRGMDSNALASSIVLVCRKRLSVVRMATRREFVATLKTELPAALAQLQRGNIAPVDLAQAAIGPGMAVYTRYSKVLDADGGSVSVQEALKLINATLDEVLTEQEGDFEANSRWALAWFEQNGFDESEYGDAETLSKAKNTSVAGLAAAGILHSKRGKVRLFRPEELPEGWDPTTEPRLNAWEIVHQLIRALGTGGEGAAAALAAKLGSKAEIARELAYRLYNTSNNKKRAAEAVAYNGLVQSFPEIMRLAREAPPPARPAQTEMSV